MVEGELQHCFPGCYSVMHDIKQRQVRGEHLVDQTESIPEGNDLALVTHDAYSVSMNGRVWQWSLLPSPRMAWGGEDPKVHAGRDWHGDQGQHTFDFTLCADQNLESGKLNTLARQQAQPPVGEQSATLPVAPLRASRGGRRADASY